MWIGAIDELPLIIRRVRYKNKSAVMPCWRHGDCVGKLSFRVVELVIDRESGQMEME